MPSTLRTGLHDAQSVDEPSQRKIHPNTSTQDEAIGSVEHTRALLPQCQSPAPPKAPGSRRRTAAEVRACAEARAGLTSSTLPSTSAIIGTAPATPVLASPPLPTPATLRSNGSDRWKCSLDRLASSRAIEGTTQDRWKKLINDTSQAVGHRYRRLEESTDSPPADTSSDSGAGKVLSIAFDSDARNCGQAGAVPVAWPACSGGGGGRRTSGFSLDAIARNGALGVHTPVRAGHEHHRHGAGKGSGAGSGADLMDQAGSGDMGSVTQSSSSAARRHSRRRSLHMLAQQALETDTERAAEDAGGDGIFTELGEVSQQPTGTRELTRPGAGGGGGGGCGGSESGGGVGGLASRSHTRTSTLMAQSHDLVLVYANNEADAARNERRRALAARARSVGLVVHLSLTRDGEAVLMKLSAPDAVYETMAEHCQLEKRLINGGYTEFSRKFKGSFESSYDGRYFTSLERIQLLYHILQASKEEGGCGIRLEREVAEGTFSAVVPIHEAAFTDMHRGRLVRSWCRAKLKLVPSQPLDDVRDYFGEEIAMYFAFFGAFTRSLLLPTSFALVVLVSSLWYGSMDSPLGPAYAFVVLVWVALFAKAWRREEALLAWRWNVEDLELKESERLEFRGTPARGFYTTTHHFVDIADDESFASHATLIKRFTPLQRLLRTALTWSSCALLLSLGVACMLSTLAYRTVLMYSLFSANTLHNSKVSVQLGSLLGGALVGVFVGVTNGLYGVVAKHLTHFENHRTEAAHADALVTKTFAFHFVNSYSPLFYIAFIKANNIQLFSSIDEYCHDLAQFDKSLAQILAENGGYNPHCMDELSMQATALCLLDLAVAQLGQFIVPWLKRQMQLYKKITRIWEERGKGPPKDMSIYEHQTKLATYEGVSSEYNDLLIQIGYVVLFASAFPLAALVCYANNVIEIRSDAFKLLVNTQRPMYRAARGIGRWNNMLQLLGVVGVFTNVGIVATTSARFHSWLPFTVLGCRVDETNKVLFLVLVEHVILLVTFAISAALSDQDELMIIERARQQFQTRAALNVLRGKAVVQQEGWDDAKIPLMYWRPVK